MSSEAIWRLPLNIIKSEAERADVDPTLVAAICWQESAGKTYATRYEPKFKYLFNVRQYASSQGHSKATEENQQKQSYGLMQIMGATARWLGYNGALGALYQPKQNLYWGIKYLKHHLEKHGNVADAVASYNAGSPRRTVGNMYENQEYVDSVFDKMKWLEGI